MGDAIAHVGVLVPDLPTAADRWTRALGDSFSPIVRYRPAGWHVRGAAHEPVDLRQVVYIGVNPSIEIQEQVPNGTHDVSRGAGGHHLGFPPVADTKVRAAELAGLGVHVAGGARYEDRSIIEFTEHEDLDGVSTEWVELSPGHLDLKDDGTPVDTLPDGSETIFEPETIVARGGRPESGIAEIGVVVDDIDATVERWARVTDRSFAESVDGSAGRSALSDGPGARIRLVQASGPSDRRGIRYLAITTDDLDAVRARLRSAKVPVALDLSQEVRVDPTFLNGVSLRYSTTS